jgi:protein TonB
VRALRIILILTWGLLVSPGAPFALQAPAEQPHDKAAFAPPERIRVGGELMGTKLVHRVTPKYPKEAMKKHIRGTVRMEILVDRDGRVIETNVLSGDALLARAATQALRKWRYRPILLNGKPVQVLTEVNINFETP